jgi:DNA-binding XRE family transcriptional regulator
MLNNNLKEVRMRLSLSQEELGRITGISRTTVGRIERGQYMPSLRLAFRLAKKLGLRIEDIFTLEKTEQA